MTTDDASPGREPRESIPMCCDGTIGMVRRQRIARRCPVCREWYYPATEDARDALLPAPPPVDVPAPVRPPTPGAQPDARVQVATEERLRPSQAPPVARLTHTEDDELVRVRRLLCELRPDRGGRSGSRRRPRRPRRRRGSRERSGWGRCRGRSTRPTRSPWRWWRT